MFSLTC